MEPDIIATSSPTVTGSSDRNDIIERPRHAAAVGTQAPARPSVPPAAHGSSNGIARRNGHAAGNGHRRAEGDRVRPGAALATLVWEPGVAPLDPARMNGHATAAPFPGEAREAPGFYLAHGKRLLDLVAGGLALLLSAPVLLLAALAIKLESRGPVFYRSTRIGRGGRPFTFYKLRSMVKGADRHRHHLSHLNECDGPVFKMSRDPRVTVVGRILRTTSLDELPQLWNVVRGDMSLVGPRPPIPEEVSHYLPWQMRRLDVKPGLTCIWQVSGRSRIGFEEWMRLDLEYIRKQSLTLDLQILARTVPAVLSREGAY